MLLSKKVNNYNFNVFFTWMLKINKMHVKSTVVVQSSIRFRYLILAEHPFFKRKYFKLL